jgi:hypothetical protein
MLRGGSAPNGRCDIPFGPVRDHDAAGWVAAAGMQRCAIVGRCGELSKSPP